MRATAIAAAAAVLLAAGCGTVRDTGSTALGRAGTSPAARMMAAAAGPATITAAQAARLARSLLARVNLPPGARVRPGPPPVALHQPASTESGEPSASLHRLWTAAEPMVAVQAFWHGHAPAGMTWNGSGQSNNGSLISSAFTGYRLGRLPAGVYSATLGMSVAPAGLRASVIRADVQVIWYPPRSAAEQVPGSVHVATVTASTTSPARTVTRTVTSAAQVRRLAALLNGTHAAPRGSVISCPLQWVSYRIAFAASAHAAPSLVATETSCPDLQVTAGGRPQPSLVVPAGLQALVISLTHVPMSPRGTVTPPAGHLPAQPGKAPAVSRKRLPG